MASPFSLKREAKAKAGSGDYNTLLKKDRKSTRLNSSH